MGHERLGLLPKSKKWRAIVSELATFESGSIAEFDIAEQTLAALGPLYRDLANDASVRVAFSFLVELARSTRFPEVSVSVADKSPLGLASELARRMAATSGSLETRELVKRAAADAIATWHRENSAEQSDLFSESAPQSRWTELGSGAGFCEISRLYFAKLTERYLNYFLEREASAVIPDLGARERFQKRLYDHVSDVSRHSFESAKITQSYAAGWFNKNALKTLPSDAQTKRFLAYAFEKLREEFRREGEK